MRYRRRAYRKREVKRCLKILKSKPSYMPQPKNKFLIPLWVIYIILAFILNLSFKLAIIMYLIVTPFLG